MSPELGKFESTQDIVQVCQCFPKTLSANLLEWDGVAWLGAVDGSDVDLPPPPGCVQRVIWIGHELWTPGGEAFALRLDKPLIPGKEYAFVFTYARDGVGPDIGFSPRFYSNSVPDFPQAKALGQLPPTEGWRTDTLSFKAEQEQSNHTWLIIHAKETSGSILANCDPKTLVESNFLGNDSTLCAGTSILLQAPVNDYYLYKWNTGHTTASIEVAQPGLYEVELSFADCPALRLKDDVEIEFIDCTVILVMPNFFSPNGDTQNPQFKPKQYNYIHSGQLVVLNRWGERVFEGDLFVGWNGLVNGQEAATGVYYWETQYVDSDGVSHYQRGFVSLAR